MYDWNDIRTFLAIARTGSAAHARRRDLPQGIDELNGHAIIAYAGPITGMPHIQSFMAMVPGCERSAPRTTCPTWPA